MPAKKSAHRLAAQRNLLIGGAILLLAGALVWWAVPSSTSTVVDVDVPELSPVAQAGQEAFQKHCAMCHGPTAGGTEQGPPLIHRLYVPGHHGDAAFVLAAMRGVPQHHWNFSNMPPVPDVGERSLQQITAYIRELQRANGIE